MEKKSICIVALLLMLILPSLSFAGGPSGKQIIKNINVDSTGKVRIWGNNGPWLNPDACDSSSEIVLLSIDNGVTNEYYSEMYALVAASFLQGKRVSGWLDGCAPPIWGAGTVPLMKSVGAFE